MVHQHRTARSSPEYCWAYCVSPESCPSERTHGNIAWTETCSCGATREVEANGGTHVQSRWRHEEVA